MEQPDDLAAMREQRDATAFGLRVLDERIKIAEAERAAADFKDEPCECRGIGCFNMTETGRYCRMAAIRAGLSL